jgi:hypothetical protein
MPLNLPQIVYIIRYLINVVLFTWTMNIIQNVPSTISHGIIQSLLLSVDSASQHYCITNSMYRESNTIDLDNLRVMLILTVVSVRM